MSTSHDPEKSSSVTPDHSPSADATAPSADDNRADGTGVADNRAADQQSTLQYQPGHADGDQRAADLYGHSQYSRNQADSENPGAHEQGTSQHGSGQHSSGPQPGPPQSPGHYSGGHYSNGQVAADQPAGSQQSGAHQYGSQSGPHAYGSQPVAAQPDSRPGADQYGSQPGSYGQQAQSGSVGQQAVYAQQAGYGQQAGYAQPTGYAQQAGYAQPGTAAPADQRGFFKSLFDFRFTTFVATRWAGIIYILAIVAAVFAWIATIISGIAAGSASRVAMSYWEPEPSFSPWPLLFAILFGWIVPALWVIFVRLGLELIVANVRTAEHTKRLADSIGR